MKKALGIFLSMTIAVSMIAGCGGSGSSTAPAESAPAEEVSAEEAVEETAEADKAEADADAADADQADAVAADQTDAVAADQSDADSADPADATAEADPADAGQTNAAASTEYMVVNESGDDELKPLATIPGTNIGGMRPAEEVEDPDELTAEDTDRLDRAMRAYTPPADSLLKNKATTYYYYENMTKDQQALYDGMYMCATDPTSVDNIAVANVSIDPRSAEFREVQTVAFWGLLYDHPELFWLYNGTEANMGYGTPYENDGSGNYVVYYFFDEPFDDFEEMMTKFNSAADAFLADIDLSASEEVVAKDIHDKLIDLVTYDTPVMQDTSYNGYCNLAHTAYGALVEDSDGNANWAVCDGYSQAYVYLLQQAGIDAAVIVGVAGNTAQDAGGHAWSVVEMGGDWYEVDTTWDDVGSLDEQVEAIKDVDPFSYGYYYEALSDPDYRGKLEHALCYLTTVGIKRYEPDEYYDYVTKDGKYILRLQSASIHDRADEFTYGYEDFGLLMKYAPIAEGVVFKLR